MPHSSTSTMTWSGRSDGRGRSWRAIVRSAVSTTAGIVMVMTPATASGQRVRPKPAPCNKSSQRQQHRVNSDVHGLVETGDVVGVQRQRTGGKVFDKMASTARPGDQQHVVSDRQQPRESDLGWCRAVAGSNTVDNWIVPNGVMLCLRPTQRTERNERDTPGGALLKYWRRRPIREVVDVLDADDVGDLQRRQQVCVRDVADPDASDQTFVPGGHQGA